MPSLTKNQWIAVAVALVVVCFVFGIGAFFFPFLKDVGSGDTINKTTTVNSSQNQNSGLVVEDRVLGTGAVASVGSEVTVNYVGTFALGKKFDSSYDRGVPFPFVLGAGQVIRGWDQGIVGMKVGGKRHLIIPPALGYGSSDYGPIPGNSTLVFDIELVGVK